MLITADELKEIHTKFNDIDDDLISRKLAVIENAIRKHTNNKFQNELIRFNGAVVEGKILWQSGYLKVGDTIEISNGPNKGLYTIKKVGTSIEVNEPLYDYPTQLITKIEYPVDIVEGAISLLDWELLQGGKDKSGVASETISRHSVSYVQRTGDNMVSGYPVELFNFCEDYKVMRT